MKMIPKALTIIFCLFALTQCFFILFSQEIQTANTAKANDSTPSLTMPNINFSIGKFTNNDFTSVTCKEDSDCSIPWIGEYIAAIFQYLIGIIGIVSAIVLMYAGVRWLTAGGNMGTVNDAQEWIKASLTGLTIGLSSYLILYTINPNLVIFKPIVIHTLKTEKLELAEIDPYSEIANGPNGQVLQTKGQECFYEQFGNSESAVSSQLVTINCSALGQIQVHSLAKGAFEEACGKIPADAKTTCGTPLLNGGTYNWRMINTGNGYSLTSRSLHSFGIALDINPNDNNCPTCDNMPRNSDRTCRCAPNIPDSVIQAFRSTSGFRWGGDYRSKCDNMHFEWLGSCAK